MSEGETPGPPPRPVPLGRTHQIDGFDCGREEVNRWLRDYARQAKAVGSAVTYVVCEPGSERVIGYYALAMGSAEPEESPPRLSKGLGRNFEIPIARLVWLGTDEGAAGQGLGTRLLLDACRRVLEVAQLIGCRAVIVDAIDDQVASWYERYDFARFPDARLTLYALVKDLRATLQPGGDAG